MAFLTHILSVAGTTSPLPRSAAERTHDRVSAELVLSAREAGGEEGARA